MKILSEYKDADGRIHMTARGRYGIQRSGTGYIRSQVIDYLAARIGADESAEEQRRADEFNNKVMVVGLVLMSIVLTAGFYLWAINRAIN